MSKKNRNKNEVKPHERRKNKKTADKKPISKQLIEGTVDASGKGYGFLVRDGGDDLFIAASDMNTALGGDRVLCELIGNNRGGEARVVKVTERANSEIVGVYRREGSSGIVAPDNVRLGSDVFIKNGSSNGARDGEKVVVKIVNYVPFRRPEGVITEVLGYPDDDGVDELSIMRSYGLREEFPREVVIECESVPQCVDGRAAQGRKDYRDELIITIDGDDSRDFDDAVTLTTTKDGLYRLGVHIADVSEYVRSGTALNKEAYERGTSVYFPSTVIPMLPLPLSNGICSLNEGEDRLTLSVIMYIDNLGNVVKHKIREGIIRSRARMTYTQVHKILEGDSELCARYGFAVPMLKQMRTLAQLLRNKRVERGNIEFDIPECKIVTDEHGRTTDVVKCSQLVSHKIIEEFMLACNETVAEKFASLKAPFVFRAHAAPPDEKVQTLIGFISALGLSFKGNVNEPKSIDYARFLSGLDSSVSGVVNRVALRSMSKAVYRPDNIGHFGLAAPYYCHFTSPIRRYPDLMIHRIIKDYIHNGEKAFKKYADSVEEISKHCSDRERAAEAAERKIDDVKKAEYMRGKIGEVYTGIISGVTEWGVFVELPNTVEGLIRTENLPDGGYTYNAALFRLDSPLHSFKLGDELQIKVDKVVGDRISFVLA